MGSEREGKRGWAEGGVTGGWEGRAGTVDGCGDEAGERFKGTRRRRCRIKRQSRE